MQRMFFSLCSVLLLIKFCTSGEVLRNITIESNQTAEAVNTSASENEEIFYKNPRFDRDFIAEKEKDLTLLISITSGPGAHLRNAARETWLLPCRAATTCDYRFFVDKNIANVSMALRNESILHNDIVFRGDWCMFHHLRHPEKINYGNVFQRPWIYGGAGVPYYQLRGLYKVDWKVCFTKWAKMNDKMAHYHAYVEDDSFTCTENLIHQTSILRYLPPEKKGLPFRTGLPAWDGFDDSSTFMSREIALAFANHYPESGFNCSHLADDLDPNNKAFLSWGNSWMGANCGWRGALYDHLDISINQPIVTRTFFDCPGEVFPQVPNKTAHPTRLPTSAPTGPPNATKHNLPCPRAGLIVHHGKAGELFVKDPMVEHMCEYCLLIDKVKEPTHMKLLWKLATAHSYHDFSSIFTQDALTGWSDLKKSLDNQEERCASASNITECMIFRRKERIKRNLRITDKSYGQMTHHFKQRMFENSRHPDPGYQAYFNSKFFTPDAIGAVDAMAAERGRL